MSSDKQWFDVITWSKQSKEFLGRQVIPQLFCSSYGIKPLFITAHIMAG